MQNTRTGASSAGSNKDGQDDFARFMLGSATELTGSPSNSVATNLALTRTFLAVKDALTDHLSPHGLGLTRAEYHFLVLLYVSGDKRWPMSEIAKELSFSPAYITKLVDQLENNGLVERQNSEVDRRVTYVHLTAKGESKCATITPAFLNFMEEVGTALSEEEMSQLRFLLAKYESRAIQLRGRPS